MTEWMSHDGYGVEGQDVCSPASHHQARCGVAFDMGHLWPAGHKWVQIGFTQRQVGVDRMLCGSSAGWSRWALGWKPGSGSPRHFGVAGRRILHPLRGAP